MTPQDAEEYTQALGQVVAGSWRQIALGQRWGVPEALGLSLAEWVQRLGGYVKLPPPERREAVMELTTPLDDGGQYGLSNVKAAQVLGVSEGTVRGDRGSQNYEPESTEQTQLELADSQNYEPTPKPSRLAKVRALAELTGTWPVIYADPPWRYEGASTPSRAIENHYPTMPLEDICALPVSDRATKQAILFLWSPAPKVAEAVEVVKRWGFDYRTNICWDKVRMGMGNYGRVRHEWLHIANRGGMPIPETDALPDSIISAPRGEHSRKPDIFYELIEHLYPGVPYLELFARRTRAGWTSWGDEVGDGRVTTRYVYTDRDHRRGDAKRTRHVTLSRAIPFAKPRPNVTRLESKRRRGSAILNDALGIHAAEGLLIDMCFNTGSMWRGLAYRPLRCDIDPRLPTLDIVADWKDLPTFTGPGRVVTAVGDPLFMSHLGKKSAMRRYASELNEFTELDVLDQVADILAAAKTMLDPVRGTLILKLGDQVHGGPRQFQWFKTLKLAEELEFLLCDEYIEEGAHMPDKKRLHRYHFDSQVRWLVLHAGPKCPGPGLTLPGRTRCAYCGRVVACDRVRDPTYCRRPRGCRQAAYRQRRA